MWKEPLVSVIIPIRNVEGYIEKCIESVQKQTHKNLEILLMVGTCDDFSIEKCVAM